MIMNIPDDDEIRKSWPSCKYTQTFGPLRKLPASRPAIYKGHHPVGVSSELKIFAFLKNNINIQSISEEQYRHPIIRST